LYYREQKTLLQNPSNLAISWFRGANGIDWHHNSIITDWSIIGIFVLKSVSVLMNVLSNAPIK